MCLAADSRPPKNRAETHTHQSLFLPRMSQDPADLTPGTQSHWQAPSTTTDSPQAEKQGVGEKMGQNKLPGQVLRAPGASTSRTSHKSNLVIPPWTCVSNRIPTQDTELHEARGGLCLISCSLLYRLWHTEKTQHFGINEGLHEWLICQTSSRPDLLVGYQDTTRSTEASRRSW